MSEQQLEKAARDVKKSFKIALLEQDMTQKDLAKILHTSRQQVNMAIKGDMAPKSRELREQMAEILHIEK
jgi:DNA-binding XRE family transcriptional regulator